MSAGALSNRHWRLMVDGGARPEPPEPGSGPDREPPQDQGPSALVLLVVTVLLVVGGYFLSMKLRDMGRLQDCVMSGRTNCAPIDRSSLSH